MHAMHARARVRARTHTHAPVHTHTHTQVAVTFRPDTAADYACSVYLDVVGRDERLALDLSGVGIGPKGVLSYDVLDLGDLFISSVHR